MIGGNGVFMTSHKPNVLITGATGQIGGDTLRNLHGHRYTLEITLQGAVIQSEGNSDNGMIMDFSDIKALAKEHLVDVWDHAFIVYERDDKVREEMGKIPGTIALFGCFLIMIIILAVLALIVVKALACCCCPSCAPASASTPCTLSGRC